jgi:tungstate transport system permease protein
VRFDWQILREAVPLITNGDPTLWTIIWFTLQVAVVSSACAALLGLPVGLALGLGRFRGRNLLRLLANASLGLPPALVGTVMFVVLEGHAPLAGLHLLGTRRVVFVAQTILCLPYIIALSAAAVQGLAPGLLGQARLLGAGRRHLWVLALREARTGVIAALLAALGSGLSEVAAIVIVGGNSYDYNQTLASSTLYYVNAGSYSEALAVAIVLLAMIVLLMGGLGLLQQQGGGIRLRFRSA